MKQRYRLTAYAREDLIDIWNYTARQWSLAQADRYLRKLEASFQKIAKGKGVEKYKIFSDANIGVARCGRHYIFFLAGRVPAILAVFHERMDCVARLGKRLARG